MVHLVAAAVIFESSRNASDTTVVSQFTYQLNMDLSPFFTMKGREKLSIS